MLVRSCILLFLSIASTYACDCSDPGVQRKSSSSDLIFRGTITALRDASKLAGIKFTKDTGKIVVFRVTRVWKGDVPQTFEMPAVEETSMCIGFWPDFLKVGADLLVYASRSGGPDYDTSICGFHMLAKNSKDLRKLGPGEEPKKQIQIPK